MSWFSRIRIGKRKPPPDSRPDDSGNAAKEPDPAVADSPTPLVAEKGEPETATERSQFSEGPALGGPPKGEPVAASGYVQEPPSPEPPASTGPNPNLPQMYKAWVELGDTMGAARDGMQTMLANRHRAAASREEARETLNQAEAAWEEARRLGEVTWRAFGQGFTASPPGITERLRTIKEIDEARRAQADLRQASVEAAWEEADGAKQKATSGLLKAIASLAAAAVQVEREMRESGNLSSVAESLRNFALEDLRSAQAIGNELALLGQMGPGPVERRPRPGRGSSGGEIDARAGRTGAASPEGTHGPSPGGAGSFLRCSKHEWRHS